MSAHLTWLYPAVFTPDPAGGYSIHFRDVPEALSQGDNIADAYEAARDALATAFEFYHEDKRPLPMPSLPEDGEYLIRYVVGQ